MRNPLNVEVTISGLTAVIKDAKAPESPTPSFVEVELIDDLTLGARESRTVSRTCRLICPYSSYSQIPIAVNCTEPSSLIISDIKFDFLSLLTVTESLAVRGRRLHDTPHQRQNKVYVPDIVLKVEVEDSGYRLHTGFIDDRHLNLFQGEWRRVDIRLHNSGSRAISELWVVTEPYSEVWVDSGFEEPGNSVVNTRIHFCWLMPAQQTSQMKSRPSCRITHWLLLLLSKSTSRRYMQRLPSNAMKQQNCPY